jgi:WhiB family redox-sensing transcriptional regulator
MNRTSRTVQALAPGSPLDDWRHGSACSGVEPELFFPIGTGPAAMRQTRLVQAVCAGCPVRVPCLRWALATSQEYGVWGGLSEDDRRNLKRRTSRARAAAAAAGTAGATGAENLSAPAVSG